MIDFLFGEFYNYFLCGMTLLAVVVFIILQFITPAYGMTFNNRWGQSIRSNWGWVLMEAPVFLLMTSFYVHALLRSQPFSMAEFPWVTTAIFVLFQLHYLQRSFIFPSLMRGTSKMPLSIIFSGIFFNMFNAYMQGGWLFFISPDQYTLSWFYSPQFIIGTVLFFAGMVINMHSDRIIRKLRADKWDNNYYLPKGFLFDKVNSANFFGELLEWFGFAVLSWSPAGLVFFLWSFANIVPRSKAVYEQYIQFFGEEFKQLKRWKIFPYIY
ncbi:MAG: 3-oxo-5-alpha-steroid 4-dehydrogenase [Bacteroidales bacterium]|nr:3-oxo-5-alpha-steroid 4-dehydrogenase [Bacteroidales bacterium]